MLAGSDTGSNSFIYGGRVYTTHSNKISADLKLIVESPQTLDANVEEMHIFVQKFNTQKK